MRELRMPRLELGDGQGDEIYLVEWLVAVGAEVREGDPVLTVETAKAQMEVEAPFDGVLLAQDAGAGDHVLPGGLLGRFSEAGVDSVLNTQVDTGDYAVPVETLSSPQGPPGVIYGRTHPRTQAPTPILTTQATPIRSPQTHREDIGTPVNLSRARIAIGQAMSASAAIPQFSVQVQAYVGQTLNRLSVMKSDGLDVTFTDVLLRAAAGALVTNPGVNLRVVDGTAYHPDGVSIAVAVDSTGGVMAPVIHQVQLLSLSELVAERRRVVAGAREGKLEPRDLGGASFTISNLGTMDIDVIVPLLTPPQVAALGVGRIRKPTRRAAVTLAFVGDHRVLDGADGARFLTCLREGLESMEAVQGVV